jgi:hypothetical protein
MSDITNNKDAFEKGLINDKVPESSLDINEDMDDDAGIGEVTFGRGATRKVLLCTKGVTLKNLVDMSK